MYFCPAPQEEYIPQVMLSSSPSPPTPSRDDSYAWPSAASAKIQYNFPNWKPETMQGEKKKAGWWQLKYFLFSPRKLGEDSHFDEYFSDGLVQPPTRKVWWKKNMLSEKTYEKSWNPQIFWPGICLANILILSDSYGFIRNEESSPFMESSFMESLIVERNHAYTEITWICCPCEYDIFVHPPISV